MNHAKIMRKFPVSRKNQIPDNSLPKVKFLVPPKLVFIQFALSLLTVSCDQPEIIKDLNGRSFELLDQDSSQVTFPDDFRGKVTVLGFIYTHCPDVCPAITANMKNISEQLENPENVQFVGITFDPRRDTPSVLKKYMKQFNLDEEKFTFVTGDTSTVHSMLNTLNITAEISSKRTTGNGDTIYFMRHTNRISLMDKEERLRLEYSGSYSKPEHIVEGINKLR